MCIWGKIYLHFYELFLPLISLVGSSYPEQPPSLLGDTIPIFQCRSKIIQQVAMELHKHSCSRNQRLPISHKHPLTTPDSEQTSLTGGEFSGHAIQMIHFQYLLLLYQFF